jgi:hydroxyethylthiazole kinase
MHGLSRTFPGDLAATAADLVARLRERGPRVHCVTNTVAQAFTANVLLAAGAVPSMTIAPQEISDFAARADAFLVNLGTFDSERRAAIDIALEQVAQHGHPWVLDPVLIDVSQPRAAYARTLSGRGPAAIRLNAAEFVALADAPATAESIAVLSAAKQSVIGLTGAADIVSDASRKVEIRNGHPLMNSVTAMGCAASALVAACLCVEKDPFVATASALLVFGVAGEAAAETAKGPGSFAVHFIDALHNLDRVTLTQRAKVT